MLFNHPRDARIEFIRDPHGYQLTLPSGIKQPIKISPSRVVNSIDPFDPDLVSRSIARRHAARASGGVHAFERKRVQLRNAWKMTQICGTNLHAVMEERIRDGTWARGLSSGPFHAERAQAAAFLRQMAAAGCVPPYRTEWVVFHDAGYAGTIDLVMQRADGGIVIADWKRSPKHMPEPIPGRRPTRAQRVYLKRAVQLTLYAKMLEDCYGLTVVDTYIVALHPTFPPETPLVVRVAPHKYLPFAEELLRKCRREAMASV